MIELGKYNTLTAVRSTPFGMVLGAGEEEVLLPNKYVPDTLKTGDDIEVFVYLDFEERIVATTLKPKIVLNQFAVLEVKDVNSKVGAFLDWGLEKDLMVPFSEQQKNMRKGESYLVYLFLDTESNRLVASSKIDKFVKKDEIKLLVDEEVDLLIGDSSDIGITTIINNQYRGLIYHNEVFKKIYIGERTKGYIKEIRPDNKIDVSLQKQGFKNIDPSAVVILEKLKANNGYLKLTDSTDPAEIMKQLEMSKKTFKKAIGVLYKERKIRIENDGIYLS